MCCCSNTRVVRTPNKSQHTKLTVEKNIPLPLLLGSNSQPFNHESGVLTNKLSVKYPNASPAPLQNCKVSQKEVLHVHILFYM